MAFLMWQYKSRDVGVFHVANTAAQKTKMINKGYVDITGQQSWSIPYPTGRLKTEVATPAPAPVVPESPAQTLPETEVTTPEEITSA